MQFSSDPADESLYMYFFCVISPVFLIPNCVCTLSVDGIYTLITILIKKKSY